MEVDVKPLVWAILIALTVLIPSTRAVADDLPLAADLVKATLLADTSAIEPGKPFNVGVMLKIAPRWHVYWINAGDAGIPTTLKFDLPSGFTVSEIRYPTPRRFVVPGNIVLFGYADEVMLQATITPPANLRGGSVPIKAVVKYLVCEDSCIPGEASLELSLPTGAASRANEAVFSTWSARLPAPVGDAQAISSESMKFTPSPTRKDEAQFELSIDWKSAPPDKLDWFPPASDALIFNDIKVQTQDRKTRVTASVQRLEGQKLDINRLESVLGYDLAQGRRGVAIPLKLPTEMGWQ
jgi:DsbC/DsbD-like thiol-disulfide interchange protein